MMHTNPHGAIALQADMWDPEKGSAHVANANAAGGPTEFGPFSWQRVQPSLP